MEEKKGPEAPRKTVGELAYELMNKTPYTVPVKEFGAEILTGNDTYMKNLWTAVKHGKDKGFGDLNKKFYILVLTNKERLWSNVMRNRYKAQVACPIPAWAQSVYQYSELDDRLQLMWTIPDRESCDLLRENALALPDEEKTVLKYVLDFYDGTLDKLCYHLNGVEIDIVTA